MLEIELYVQVITLDFIKDFDTVWQVKLVDKLSILNIHSRITGCIAIFHKSRNHTTTFEGYASYSSTMN